MKVSSYAVARPAFYDRNAASAVQTYLAQVSPHSATTRWTYTVASGKKLNVEVTPCRILRLTVATVSGLLAEEITLTSGASALVMLSNYVTDNTLNVPYLKDSSASYTMYAAESLAAISLDSSTGGIVQFSMVMKGTLFDA
jgi:hypothetical protein